jgi:hypothetical protein
MFMSSSVNRVYFLSLYHRCLVIGHGFSGDSLACIQTLPHNGLAQRQRQKRRDSFSIIAHFWQNAPDSRAVKRVCWMSLLIEPALGS